MTTPNAASGRHFYRRGWTERCEDCSEDQDHPGHYVHAVVMMEVIPS